MLLLIFLFFIFIYLFFFFFFFFFFQAEDGIRDGTVTGVQTCALPIYNWLDMRDPVLFNVIVIYPPSGDPDVLLDEIEDTIQQVHLDLTNDEIGRASCRERV